MKATPLPAPSDGLRAALERIAEDCSREAAQRRANAARRDDPVNLLAIGIHESHAATLRAALATPVQGLDALRALSEAATPGPWHDRPNHKPYRIVVFGGKRAYDEGYTTADIDAATARYIVALVNWHRAILAEQGGQK